MFDSQLGGFDSLQIEPIERRGSILSNAFSERRGSILSTKNVFS